MNAPAKAEQKQPRRIGDVLIEKGIITQDQLRIALTEQKRSNQPIGKTILNLGFTTEAIMRDALSEALGQKSVDLAKVVVESDALKLIPRDMAVRYHILPISLDADRTTITVATEDTLNVVALDQLRALLGGHMEIHALLAGAGEIENAIDHFYGYELSVDGILHELETGQVDYATLDGGSGEYSQPLVRLVNALLADAVKRGASDIHFEPEGGFLRVRYRLDGIMRQIRSLHQNYWSAIAVRLKVMSGMNIAETRAPQDGRISLTLSGREIDFRVSVQPTTHGENIVLRVLDRTKGIVPLDKLDLPEAGLSILKLMMARPEGIILVTGPTGSGKTTTLYSMLSYLNSETVNIMTLEDPVEYPMALIRQTSVNEVAKVDFANGIRSMMRQDPDIILVGEIRDKATADMAMRAAMTGHQVYSTLHTNSALGAIPRLLDLGIVPDILAGNIIGIVAQRLVRKLCPHCRKPDAPNELECRLLHLGANDGTVLYRATGCEKCDYQGYKGRMAVMELLKVDTEMDELIAAKSSRRVLHQYAVSKGFRTLAEDGLQRALQGITTVDEVSRTVDLTDLIS